MDIAGKVFIVTGGASGIGKLMGRNCLQRGGFRRGTAPDACPFGAWAPRGRSKKNNNQL